MLPPYLEKPDHHTYSSFAAFTDKTLGCAISNQSSNQRTLSELDDFGYSLKWTEADLSMTSESSIAGDASPVNALSFDCSLSFFKNLKGLHEL